MDWVAQFEGQLLVCAVLAKALYGMPDREWLDSLLRERTFCEIPYGIGQEDIERAIATLRSWSSENAGGLSQQSFAALQSDYTRLFVGPSELPAPPWESVYRNKDRSVFQRETVSVKNWYSRFEMVLASDYNEPADHVGLEFSFMAHLAELTLGASEKRDGEQVRRLVSAQRGFLTQHMMAWVPRWSDDVIRSSQSKLYQGLAWLARGTVIESATFLAVDSPS